MMDETFPARHRALAAGFGDRPDPEDPAQVLAMPVVLHLPKADPPPRSALLEAAASASIAVCLDPRSGPGEDWEAPVRRWLDARIRKVSRRARGAQWAAVGEVAGVTVETRGAQVRALVPEPVGELDPRIKRLQIGGTDVEYDESAPADPTLPVLWVDASLGMTVGKAAAQVGHASMLLAAAMTVEQAWRWSESGFACSVRDAEPNQWKRLGDLVGRGRVVAVRDAGFTEVAPGSITVVAVPGVTATVSEFMTPVRCAPPNLT